MYTSNKYILIFIFLCSPTFLWSQNYTLDLADRFFNSGSYYNAITEYKRFIYFSTQSNQNLIGNAYYKIGLAFRNQRLWTECIGSLQKSIQVETQEEVKNERKIALAVALIASGNYSKAEFLLLKVEMYIKIPQLIQKAAFFRGICAIYTSKWKEAREALNIYFSHSNNKSQEMFNKINTLLVKAQNSKYKSPKLAKTLSTILPGFGQIYAGNWLSGINALLINSATGYLFFNDLLKQQYKDALFNGFFLFGRFYSGNRINAENAVRKYNQSKKQKFANQILEILQKNKYDK